MEERMLMAFDSTQQALRAEMLLDYAGIDNDMRPTLKEITAGCALSLEFPAENLPDVKEIIIREKVELKGVYFIKEHKYVKMKK
ncbi:DUF3343 domain-containing protein [Paenibacillus larvae]